MSTRRAQRDWVEAFDAALVATHSISVEYLLERQSIVSDRDPRLVPIGTSIEFVTRNVAHFGLVLTVLMGCSHGRASSPPQRNESSRGTPPTKPRRVLPTNPPGDQPQYVPPTVLEALRVAGTKDVVPDARTQALMSSNGAKTVIGSFKVCVNESGELTAVDTMRPTGYREYDEEILNAIAAWSYEPYRVLDRTVPVCSAVTFVYQPDLGGRAKSGQSGTPQIRPVSARPRRGLSIATSLRDASVRCSRSPRTSTLVTIAPWFASCAGRT